MEAPERSSDSRIKLLLTESGKKLWGEKELFTLASSMWGFDTLHIQSFFAATKLEMAMLS